MCALMEEPTHHEGDFVLRGCWGRACTCAVVLFGALLQHVGPSCRAWDGAQPTARVGQQLSTDMQRQQKTPWALTQEHLYVCGMWVGPGCKGPRGKRCQMAQAAGMTHHRMGVYAYGFVRG